MPRITLIRHPMHDLAVMRQITPGGLEVRIVDRDGADFSEVLRETDYLIGYADKNMDDDFYAIARALKLMQLISAGYDKANIAAAQRAGVAICNNGGANSGPVAEHALLLMLALARQLLQQREDVVTGRWQRNNMSEQALCSRAALWGIVGLGAIGKKVARLGGAFGMNVRCYDIVRFSEDAEGQLGVKFRLPDEILATSDFVSLHVPFTPRTHRMFGGAQFARMKKTAFFINTAPGEVVDEAKLCDALAKGVIAGAGLDCFEQEPLSPDNPLLKLGNVVVSAHLAGPIWDTQFPKFPNAFDNILRVERGERPLWLIPELRNCALRLDKALG